MCYNLLYLLKDHNLLCYFVKFITCFIKSINFNCCLLIKYSYVIIIILKIIINFIGNFIKIIVVNFDVRFTFFNFKIYLLEGNQYRD